MWAEHFTRMRRHAEAGWGKSFKEASSLKEWQHFQTMQDNLRSFAAHKQHRMIEELRALKTKGISRDDWNAKAESVMRRQNKMWLKAELQAVTAAAQSAESWDEFERRKYLYPNLQYITAGDERVRESHRLLDNVVRPVDDPFWNTHTPPLGWGCRCKLIQTDEESTELPGDDIKIPKGFRHNPGKTKIVFDQAHPYFDVPILDTEVIESISKGFHATITKGEVNTWAKENLVGKWSGDWGLPEKVTLTEAEVQSIVAAEHADMPSRNELLYILSLLSGNMKYLGQSPGNANIVTWYHYLFESGGKKHYLNLGAIKVGNTDRIGIQTITDAPPNINSP